VLAVRTKFTPGIGGRNPLWNIIIGLSRYSIDDGDVLASGPSDIAYPLGVRTEDRLVYAVGILIKRIAGGSSCIMFTLHPIHLPQNNYPLPGQYTPTGWLSGLKVL